MTIAVDLGRKATKQTNKSTCREIIHLQKLVDYVNEQGYRRTNHGTCITITYSLIPKRQLSVMYIEEHADQRDMSEKLLKV